MKTKISLRIEDLEALLKAAKERLNDQHSPCVDIEVQIKTDQHGGSDTVWAYLQSGWAECDSDFIYTNKQQKK